jgi:hypothetical protein
MAIPKVSIEFSSGGLGVIRQFSGGSPGIIVPIATAPGSHAMGDVKSYTSFDDLPTEFKALPSLINYFKIADGVEVFVMPVPTTKTVQLIVDGADSDAYAKKLIEASDKISFIGVVGTLLQANIATALTNAQALCNGFVAKYRYVFALLPYSFKIADTPADLTLGSSDRAGLVVSYAGDEIGLILGKLAVNSVHRNIGRVKDGALPLDSCKLDGYETPALDVAKAMDKVAALHDKGYITIRTIVGKTGYYFTDDKLATAPGDYSNITNSRVIDKAAAIVYDVYLNEVLDEAKVGTDGKLLPAYVAYLTGIVENAINGNMADELNSFSVYINPDQNVLSTSKMNITLRIVPFGYIREIVIDLGFINPNA